MSKKDIRYSKTEFGNYVFSYYDAWGNLAERQVYMFYNLKECKKMFNKHIRENTPSYPNILSFCNILN